MLLDLNIASAAVYTAIIYGIFCSFFEIFPLVLSTPKYTDAPWARWF
jgi:hypothetical protein